MSFDWRPSRKSFYIALTAPIITYLTARTVSNLVAAASTSKPRSTDPRIYSAPSISSLTPSQLATIPYPPDSLPNGRSIPTLNGNIRTYEWGPPTGRKVLMIHGISTPCIALAKIATLLVEREGCRVMLFDLPGRGYSDCVNPRVRRQDGSFFCQVVLDLLVAATTMGKGEDDEEVSWLDGKVTLLGYSLGGGIAADFTRCYPHLVEGLVLLAPGGVLRRGRFGLWSRVLYGDVLPEWMVERIVARQLGGEGSAVKGVGKALYGDRGGIQPVEEKWRGDEKEGQHVDLYEDSQAPIFPDRPSISPATAVAWQLGVHPVFIPAFISSIKYAPLHDGRERWKVIGDRCAAKRRGDTKEGLKEGRVLLLLGDRDQIIVPGETEEDAKYALGEENVKVVWLEGDHGLEVSNAESCVNAMVEFWGEG